MVASPPSLFGTADGRHFFLMQNEQMKNAAACAVVDENGKLVVDAAQKFDEDTLRQINEHLP